MNPILKSSLAQIVNNNHRAAAIFEKYHLDFCCKGKRSLEQACTEEAIKSEELIAELENVGPVLHSSLDFGAMSLTQLTDYIVATHHSYVKREMPLLLNYLDKIVYKHGERHPELNKVRDFFSSVKEEMEEHMQKEEHVLFPRIRHIECLLASGKDVLLDFSYLMTPVTSMEQEHEEAGIKMTLIRELTNDYTPPADACTTYRLSFSMLKAFEEDLHQHVHLENNILFPKALTFFSSDTQCSLN